MSSESTNALTGRVASLHLHPVEPGEPLTPVKEIELVANQGIAGNPRYFGRISKTTGKPSRRQVTLMAREEIAAHAATLGMQTIAPGTVRANIETAGIDLVPLIGKDVAIGSAVLHFYEARTPCNKMDEICQGLRKEMESGRQGVLAEVIQDGRINVGDEIIVVKSSM